MRDRVIGWDVGGANIKAALLAEGVRDPRVVEMPFPLWREPQRLTEVLTAIAGRLGEARTMAVTMTAELADCFRTKREGVGFVVQAFAVAFPEAEARFYGVDGAFHSAAAAVEQPLRVAASNWHASATLVARTHPDAVFVDVGSTTTDIIPIVSGHIEADGRTDTERLVTGELVYTGALRTPLCAMVSSVPIRARRCRVAAEHFAIAADVYRWLERISDADYTCETPDGRGTGRADAGARLARMVCADVETIDAADITGIAEHAARAQARRVASGMRQVLRRLRGRAPTMAVLAGQGSFIARPAAERVGLTVVDLAAQLGADAARVAPAAAVAWLRLAAGESQ
jgi:probable H4MPT-linked C1 transfer pathway protein